MAIDSVFYGGVGYLMGMLLFKKPALRGLSAGAIIVWNTKPLTEIVEEWDIFKAKINIS